jgi:tetratricopeptide (TPR) repeat protein
MRGASDVWHDLKTYLLMAVILISAPHRPAFGWSWDSGDNVLPSVREDLDNEIAAYRQQVGNGLPIHDRVLALDRLIGNYKPLGLNVGDLETEQSRLLLQEKQQQLRNVQAQDEATLLYERGVAEYHDGQYQSALDTFREAERLLPQDSGIKELRRKLEGVTPIIDAASKTGVADQLIRLSMIRYLENDPKRAVNALIYATEQNTDRPELARLLQLIETDHPDLEVPKLTGGVGIVEYKLRSSLEAIYDGRYLTAITECSDVLDLEPNNVLAMTRLGSAYYSMNEREKARQVWTRALQLDPNNQMLKKFLYGNHATLTTQKAH